jgi:F-type H+-transporting ATPase subunit a
VLLLRISLKAFVFAVVFVLGVMFLQRICPVSADIVHRGAADLFSFFSKITITNALLTNWIVLLCVVFIIRRIVGSGFAPNPTRAQTALELLIEKLRDVFEPVVGKRVFRHVFPFLFALFVYILIENWSGLLPGVGAFGFVDSSGDFRYFFRPVNADLNATIGLAIASFLAWAYFVARYAGPMEFLHDTFGNKAQRDEVPIAAYASMAVIFICVGFIDLISILFRVVSLAFRLYGNTFGGENLITRMLNLFAYVIPLPFYFLELLIGAIQAFIFTLLTAVYIGLLTNNNKHAIDE